MPIPSIFNPMGRGFAASCFELTVKPGVLGSGMVYGFIPYWNEGGYCNVDWGDGRKDAAAVSGTTLNHTYETAGIYTVKITSDCYQVRLSATGYSLIAECSSDPEILGALTVGNYMFYRSSNAELKLSRLPDGMTSATYMFQGCSKASLPLTALPASLTNGRAMFQGCSNAQLPFTALPEKLVDGLNMFLECSKASFCIDHLPSGLKEGQNLFSGCSNSHISITSLPANLKSANGMFSKCYNTEIDLDTLAANAPAAGWTALTNITNMFYGCSKVTGSRSAFLAKCPENITGADSAFTGTNTTE